MLIRKLFRTIGKYKAQFISMVIMITMGVGVFVGFQIEWMTIDTNTASFYKETGLADYRMSDEGGFTEEEADELAEKEGIDEVSRFFAASADVDGTDGDTLSLTVTENPEVSGFTVTDGNRYDEDSEDGIWLSDRYAAENGIEVGDHMDLTCRDTDIEGTVKGLVKSGEYAICVRDASQIMPDFETHGFAYISPDLYEDAMGYPYYPSLYALSGLDREDFSEKAEDVMGSRVQVLDKDSVVSYAGPQGEIEEGRTVAGIMPPIFLLIAFLTMMTTMQRLVANEKLQIGTLKALGFKDRKILRHYTSYALITSIIGCALGVGAGYIIGYCIDNPDGSMGSYLDMTCWDISFPMSALPVIIITIILMSLVGYLSTRKMLKGTAADALRPYSPKQMKALSIEKTKFFERLSFGTRWNLRDTIRHKARTAMSIIGVMGCFIILIGVLGLKDSVNSFIQNYYHDAMNYSTRIYIDEGASDETRDDIIDRYDGDSSATMGVDYEGDAIMTEIHHSERDMVFFLSPEDEKIKLGDEGAYISMRIADEYGLEEGRTFTVTPYGTDDDFDIEIAGIIRSASEGMFMTDGYADSIDLDYRMDSVYTDTLREDVEVTDDIKSVQSREMISSSFDAFMDIMHSMIFMLILVGMILGLVVLYNLGIMMYTERSRELATLKVVGFKDRKLAALLHGQTLWTTITGMILGFPCGYGVLSYLILKLGEKYEMCPHLSVTTVIISIILTLGVSLFVSFLTARKSRKIDMVSALKSAE